MPVNQFYYHPPPGIREVRGRMTAKNLLFEQSYARVAEARPRSDKGVSL
jgi:hypothetical protein